VATSRPENTQCPILTLAGSAGTRGEYQGAQKTRSEGEGCSGTILPQAADGGSSIASRQGISFLQTLDWQIQQIQDSILCARLHQDQHPTWAFRCPERVPDQPGP